MIRQAFELVADLKQFIANNGLTQMELQHATGVDQSQISRILNGSAKRVGKGLKALCKYANIPLEKQHGQIEDNPVLMVALRETWDGSERHAGKLAELIRRAGPILSL